VFESTFTMMCGSGQHQLIVGLDCLKESTDSEIDVIEEPGDVQKTHTVKRIVE